MTAPIRLEGLSLLPHGGDAGFVCEIVEYGDDRLVCVGRIPAKSPFAQDGMVPGFVLMELAAQAAAIEVLARMGDGGPPPQLGYLARAHGLSWPAEGVPADTPLTASVYRDDSLPPLHNYRATVTLDGVVVFTGAFSIYVEAGAS